MKKAIGYIRVSTTEQDLLRQQILIKEWCSLNDCTLIQTYEDKLSGTKLDRKGYMKLQATTKDDADIIVVSELSRLSRSKEIMKTLVLINDLLESGLDVCFIDNNKIYKGGEELELYDIITIAVEAKNAADERTKIVERMRSGRLAKFLTYPNMCIGKVPFGYDSVDNPEYKRNVTPKKLLVRNENAEVVKDIFRWIIEGKTLRTIAATLRAKGIKPNSGIDIDESFISQLVRSKKYMGEWVFSKHTVQGDAIVTPEIWHKAHECLHNRALYEISSGKNFNPLKGILKCPCGKSMYIVHMYKYYQYRCRMKKNKYYEQICDNGGIDRDIVVPCCWWAIKNQVNKEDFIKQTSEEVRNIETRIKYTDILISALDKDIEENERQKDQLTDNIAGCDNADLLKRLNEKFIELVNKGTAIKKEQEQYKKDKLDMVSQKEQLLKNDKIVDNLTMKEKAVIFKKYLKKVVFYGKPRVHRGFIVVTFKNGVEMVFLSIARKHTLLSVLPPTFKFDVEKWCVGVEVMNKEEDNPYSMTTDTKYYDCWQVEKEFADIVTENNIFK